MMPGVVKSTLHVCDGIVSLFPGQGVDAPKLPLATVLGSTLLKESTDLQSTLDQATPSSNASLKFVVFAPEQYVESWLQSLVLLDRLQSAAVPDGLSAVATDTMVQYVKVSSSALLVLCVREKLRVWLLSVFYHMVCTAVTNSLFNHSLQREEGIEQGSRAQVADFFQDSGSCTIWGTLLGSRLARSSPCDMSNVADKPPCSRWPIVCLPSPVRGQHLLRVADAVTMVEGSKLVCVGLISGDVSRAYRCHSSSHTTWQQQSPKAHKPPSTT